MNVGDLIKYQGELYMVVKIRPSVPVARPNLEQVVLHHAKSCKKRTVPMRWLKPHWRKQ